MNPESGISIHALITNTQEMQALMGRCTENFVLLLMYAFGCLLVYISRYLPYFLTRSIHGKSDDFFGFSMKVNSRLGDFQKTYVFGYIF